MILGYCRVSSDGQEEGTSLDEQERVIRGWAMMKGIRDFGVAVYNDVISGSVSLRNRDGGAQLLDAAVKGDTVVATKLDRLFRSARDAQNTAYELKDRGIDLVLTSLGNDPVTQNGPAKLFFGILADIAEFERDQISERTTAGIRAKKLRGGYLGGPPPYGYRAVGKGRNSRLAENPMEQRVLAVMRSLAESHTVSYVTRTLEQRGYRNRDGGKFHLVHVKRMLKNAAQIKPAAPPDDRGVHDLSALNISAMS